ncbi:MAG TPA: cyclase family protein, partial [Planctomycetaceae bacterium]
AGNDPPVGAKKPNAWGLYDMHGYLWEFVSDPWHENYAGAPTDGGPWSSPESRPQRTLRSGSWKDRHDALRSAARKPFAADGKDDAVGMRCVKVRFVAATSLAPPETNTEPQFIDLSLLVAPELPGPWPAGWPPFQINHYERIGPLSPYNSDALVIDGNNGTQLDVPPHSIPLPETNLPNAGLLGRMFTDKVAPWQFGGEACVVDCRDLLDAASNGVSPLVKRERIAAWEKKNRPLGTGDVVLFYSGYTDKYYKPLPAGRRFIADALEGKAPAWPDPDPDCMEYLGSRKVMTLGTDSASMGPLPNLAEPTHIAGLKYGMIWAESVTNLSKLPVTGAFYCLVGPKHAEGLYSEARAFAITGEPLAKRLIESARKKNVVDLSVTLSTDLPVSWPGSGMGRHRQPYLKVPLFYAANLGTYHVTHMLDSNSGTHLVPPSYALPPAGFDNSSYSAEVKGWLAEYEAKYGRRGNSNVTAEQVPLAQTCGRARVIDVKHLVGTTAEKNWPASPEITVDELKKFESREGEFKTGDVVIFFSGHNDKHFKPLPEGSACMADPLNGKSEGWPAPGPEAIMYLAGKGIRCVATDGPSLGGVEPKRALFTYWALGSKGLAGVEFLIGAGQIPKEAYFVFAPVKIRDCHGGPGRAIAFF